MLEIFFPKLYVSSVYNVPYKKLAKAGITKLIFDIDNTLAPFDVPTPDKELINLMAGLKKMGFELCLVSNNSEGRVEKFNKELKLKAVPRAGKPKLDGIRLAMKKIGAKKSTAAIIGDQLFTDMFCGNRLGITTVLVKPICERDEFTVCLKRGLEKVVFRIYLKRRIRGR